MKTKTARDVLEEMHDRSCCLCSKTDSAIKNALKELRRMMPKKKSDYERGGQGWNACRKEVLAKFK